MFSDTNTTDKIRSVRKVEFSLKEATDSDFPRVIEYYVTNGVGYSNRRTIQEVLNPITLEEFYSHLANFDRSISHFQEECRKSEYSKLFRGLETNEQSS